MQIYMVGVGEGKEGGENGRSDRGRPTTGV